MKGVKKKRTEKRRLAGSDCFVRLVRIDFAAERLHHGFVAADQAIDAARKP